MSTSIENFEVLLVDASTGLPMIPGGLAATSAPPLAALKMAAYRDCYDEWDDVVTLRHDDTDPNDLREQRWGIIVPEGPLGDRLLALARPLMDLREEQLQGRVITYRIPRGMDAETSTNWFYEANDMFEFRERPRYLLILGSLEDISIEVQEKLAFMNFVGRFHADTDEAYAAYFEKVVRWTKTPRKEPTNILFHVVRDGTAATALTHRRIGIPCQTFLQQRLDKGEIENVKFITNEDGLLTKEALLQLAGESPRSVLLVAGNSLGMPATGWESIDACARQQGNLAFGPGKTFDASDLEKNPFCPGGVWIHFGSYGAATLTTSRYSQWLEDMAAESSRPENEARALRSLTRAPERPFLSASAIAALANPHGPVAFLGRNDLAWTYPLPEIPSFKDPMAHMTSNVLRRLADGRRIGIALNEWQRLALDMTVTLQELHDYVERCQRRGEPFPAERASKALVWFLRNDAASFLLLGDPAVSLNHQR